jgi:hypothetical protein
LFFNNVCLCYMMSKLVFQFRKNEYKKTCNILKNDFTKSIFKNTKKKSIFLNLKQTHPIFPCLIHFFYTIIYQDCRLKNQLT